MVSNPFNGIFKGANNGIARLSSGASPTLNNPAHPLVPGISLKWLRTGVPSANTVAMFMATGQPGEWNFFEHELRSHVEAVNDPAVKAVLYKSSGITDWVYATGLSHWAEYTEDGHKENSPVFPFRLDFEPNPSLKKMMSKYSGTPSYILQYLD